MATAREFFRDLLEGGIPAAIDGIRAPNDPKPEQAAPSGTIADTIPGVNFFGVGSVNPQSMWNILAIAAAAAAAIYLLRR